jgi:hypothetical protein
LPLRCELVRKSGARDGPGRAARYSAVVDLDESGASFVGARLLLQPDYGYGWRDGIGNAVDLPNPFEMQIESMWRYQDSLRGGIARVTQPGHPLDGRWVTFASRHSAAIDIRNSSASCTMLIVVSRPTAFRDGWPVSPASEWVMGGFGTLSVVSADQ